MGLAERDVSLVGRPTTLAQAELKKLGSLAERSWRDHAGEMGHQVARDWEGGWEEGGGQAPLSFLLSCGPERRHTCVS